MPDISMCHGTGCPKKDTCHRFTAKPDKYAQCYFCNPPMDKDTKDCRHYWEVPKTVVKPKRKKRAKDEETK